MICSKMAFKIQKDPLLSEANICSLKMDNPARHSNNLDNVDWSCIESDCQASRVQIPHTLEGAEWLRDDSRWTQSHSGPGVNIQWPFSDCKSEVCPTPSRSLLVDEEFISWNSHVTTSLNSVSNVEESPHNYGSHFTVSSDFETCSTERSCDYGASGCTKEQYIPYRKQCTLSVGQSSLVQPRIFKRFTRSLSTQLDEPSAIKTTYKHLQGRCLPSDFPEINRNCQPMHQEGQDGKSIYDNNSITDKSTLGIVSFIHGRRRHLLPFIMKLLDEDHPCVKWINKDRRAFHISAPDGLARLWGEYKKNKRMTFTSLTRSLRLYYASGKLERLPGRHHYRLLCSDEEMQYDMDQS